MKATKRVKLASGIEGWQCHLRKNYENFEEFEYCCELWSISERLGYESPEEAWEANPIIQGSVIPSDLRIVLDENNKVNLFREEAVDIFRKFINGVLAPEQLLKKLNSINNRAKKLFGGKDKSIWFRLFKGDTLATDIQNIEKYLSSPQSNNSKFFRECVELGVNELGMEVYYS